MQDDQTYSINTFCQAFGISRALFYKLQRDGKGPRTFNLGSRVLISREAATEWVKKMECVA
jgi:predicted DNA-binding transcriptional regulator AlpA